MMPVLRAFKEKRMTNEAWFLCGPWVVIFVIGDTVFNWTFANIVFIDIPREFLTTQRLERYINSIPTNWIEDYRYDIAHFV